MCKSEPEIPIAGEDGRVSDAAAVDYAIAMREAWFSCFNAVAWLRTFHATE